MDDAAVARYRAEAQTRLQAAWDHHGMPHATRVWGFAQDLARHHASHLWDGAPWNGGLDMAILETAVWWHDVGQLQGRASHAARSAALVARYLAEQDAPPSFIEAVAAAIGPHSWSGSPWTLEGLILREADKLDYLPVPRHHKILALIASGELPPDHYEAVWSHLAQFPEWFRLSRARAIHEELRPTLDRFLRERGVGKPG